MKTWQEYIRYDHSTEDSDPSYTAIARADLNDSHKKRIAFALMTYYDLGVAADMSEYHGTAYWENVHRIYPTVRRASPRRHFRADLGLKAISRWFELFRNPETMMDRLIAAPRDYWSIKRALADVPQFGPYFIWKACDLVYVLTGELVSFEGAEAECHGSPKKGGALMFPGLGIADVFKSMIDEFSDLTALPHHTSPFDISSAETACCGWARYYKHGWVTGQETAEMYQNLKSSNCETGDALIDGMMKYCVWTPRQLKALMANPREDR